MPVLLVGLLCISELAANSVLSQRIPLSHSTVICEHLRTGQSGYLPQHLTEIYTVDLEQGWGWSANICTAKNPSIALGKSNSQPLASADSTNRESRRVFAIHGWEYEKIMFSIQGWLNPDAEGQQFIEKTVQKWTRAVQTPVVRGSPVY